MSRVQMLQTLKDYFTTKGRVLSMAEYKQQDDVPYRFIVIKRKFGNWARLETMLSRVGDKIVTFPETPEPEVPVVPVEEPTEPEVVVEEEVPTPTEAPAPVPAKKPVAAGKK